MPDIIYSKYGKCSLVPTRALKPSFCQFKLLEGSQTLGLSFPRTKSKLWFENEYML